MKTFIEFLKSIFIKKVKTPYPVVDDKILNEPDNRDIPYTAVAGITLATYPATGEVANFKTAVRFLQGQLGTCVEHSFEFVKRLFDGIIHSRRIPYVITRNELGMTEASGQGLPQREAAKVAAIVGMPKDMGVDDNTLSHKDYTSLPITQEMRDNANLYKFGGFTFPVISVNSFKQVITDKKPIAVTIAIDFSQIDRDGTVHPVKIKCDGFHETAIGAYDDTTKKFSLANWWGFDLFVTYDELEQVAKDAIVFTDIPNDLVLRAKSTQFIFNSNLALNTTSAGVGQLQSRLTAYGVYTGKIDKQYGPKTQQAVKDYQRIKGIQVDGKVGPATRKCLNDDMGIGLTKSKLDLWCEAAKQMEGAKESRNNPGNLRYVGQQYAVNDGGFCKFDTYAHGYQALRDLLIRACSGASTVYNCNGTLYDFYKVYAPASDGNDPKNYTEFVAKYMGVDPNIIIKNLL